MENICMKRDHLTLLTLIVMITTMTMAVGCVSAVLHRVGGPPGWVPTVNYTEWANQERFYVDDWLIFNFDKNIYSVLEVNKTSYDNCSDQDFITNITRGGRDVFQLTEARPYYFLSGKGFCWSGMKVAISVQEAPPSPASPPDDSITKSASPPPPTTTPTLITLLLAFSMASLVFPGKLDSWE